MSEGGTGAGAGWEVRNLGICARFFVCGWLGGERIVKVVGKAGAWRGGRNAASEFL